ncbi:peptidoglycan DD-metalloendopeptidase family protein [Thalassotalea castellviae]|uniref:Peptidoglycan DD-metalloendopeptidase family protein n=1 Tax=Thalassotalea castellviae TaxID=3075612 RepID=A0ABU3A403_9GAMM|nr:peptidoglycan DD-metalloendopeptidase family protein [Thalassotalea sp. W431]MDT0604635.1 peptidoglycan DD-metalloendopeptidase family protein [Thalassotalea sp. W431]
MFFRIVILMLILFIVGCSSRHTPAPVVDVNAQLPLSKKIKNSLKATEYIVKKGETLYSISWRAGLDVRTIAQLNNIPAPYQIFPGQKIFLSPRLAKASKNKPSRESIQKQPQIVVKKPIATNKKQEYGEVTRGQKIVKKPLSKKGSFSQKVKRWVWPVNGKIIAKFSTRKQGNKGIDIAGSRNEPVKAAADGRVVYAGDVLRGYGKLVIVKHNDDYLSAYAHNDHILVKEQQAVKAGQVIAKMGDTDAERVMLHFEVRFRGKSVNPLKYLPRR